MQERTSRQDLVVPPTTRSSRPLIIGALLCGCAGFAIVWISGMGRTMPVTTAPQPAASAATSLTAADAHDTTEPTAAEPADRYAVPSRFADPGTSQPLPASTERFPTRPASFEEPIESTSDFEEPASEPEPSEPDEADKAEKADSPAGQKQTPPGRLSRFSARQISPPDSEAAAATSDIATSDIDSEPIAVPAAPPAQLEPTAKPAAAKPAPARPTVAETAEAAADEAEKTEAEKIEPDSEKTTEPAVATPPKPVAAVAKPELPAPVTATPARKPEQPKPVMPAPPADQAVAVPSKPNPAAAAPTPGPPAAISAPLAAALPAASVTPTDTAEPTAASPAPPTPPAKRVPPPALPPQPLASDATAAPLAAGVNPFARPRPAAAAGPAAAAAEPSLQTTAGAVPFAAAPPLASPPTASAAPAPFRQNPNAPAATAAGATGQGRPGVPQLEGLQTPQLTIEKSGPRDLQVGKPARFEVTIRNVGAATAHDTVLKDSIPYGTSLIATLPPASPAASGDPTGDLLWSIGELKPGQEARVAMELMPRLEGEIGSVASVSFRSDATVRSRVTKPALEITAEPPQKTLIGESMTLELTLSNPGTGTATGVVVDGLLPEAVSHPAGREVEFDVGRLEPGTSRSITLVLTTVTPGVHEIRLAARADGGIEVARRLRAEITAPMLELAADIPSRRYLQRPATCKLKMTNTGTAPALAVELAAQLPTGMKFVRANNAGYYDERTHRVLWSLEELPAGEDGTVELVVMPTTLGPQAIVAAARNPAGLADQLTHTIEVEGLAALSFEVVDSEDPIEIGGLTEYVVRVTNQGTKAATNVELAANLLGDLEPIDAEGPVPFGVENLLVSFDPLATLAPADEAVFRIQVRGRRPGNQRVQFMLKSDDLKTPLTAEEMTHVYSDR